MKKRTKAKVLAANARKLVINPFVSEAQRRACYAKDDANWDCKEWSAVTPKGKLPARKKRKLIANVRRRLLANAKAPNPLKIDPTRTLTMRRAFAQRLKKAFALLMGRIVKLVVDDDAFGLGRRRVLGNAFCPGEGARDNSCSSVVTTHHTVTSGSNAGLHIVGVFKKGAKGYAAGEHVLADKVKVPEGHTAEDMVGFAAARPNKDGTHYVAQVHVDEPHRRQGLASSMYDTLRTKGVTLGKSPLQTDLGDKFRTGYESKYSASNVVANEHPYVALLSQERIKAFQDWLRRQNHDLLTSQTQKELWLRYAEQGFRKGQGRAFDDVRQTKLAASRPDLVGPEAQQSLRDFYAGTKDEFLRSSFGRPVAVEKVQLLAGRSFDDLENVTDDMSARMSRSLADGMVRGASPHDVAKDMADDLDISRARAETIARTEIIRAHAEGQLQALGDLGVEEVGVAVEWSTTGDDRVCPLCQPLEGVVLKLDEARGMLPRHPNCRCAWVPANVGEPDKGQKDTKSSIDRAFKESDLEVTVGKDRPQSILDNYLTNAFCPTGPGGGVNPHCSPGGSGGGAVGSHGVPVGHALTKIHHGRSHTVTATAMGFQVTDQQTGTTTHHSSLTAAAQHVQGHSGAVNGWRFFGATNPRLAGAAPAAPTSAPAAVAPPIPAPVAPTPTPATPAPNVVSTPPPSITGAVHAGSGLPVGATYTKTYQGVTHSIAVTPNGIQVTSPSGAVNHYSSLSAAATGIKGNSVPTNGWAFFNNIPRPAGNAPTPKAAATPSPTPTQPATPPPSNAPESTVPFAKETTWASGEPKAGQVLHGVPFASAPPKFWEKTKDVDVKEPPPLQHIDRVGVMIQEPDGRVWIVKPTNAHGDRKHTLPGGGVEKGLTNQQNALKEVWEETGLQVEITGHLGDFKDSNNSNNGRLYIGKRIGGAPWDAKVEDGSHGVTIKYKPGQGSHDPSKDGQYAPESSHVMLVTKDKAADLLHRTDDLAQLATVNPIKLDTNTRGQMMQELVDGLKPAADQYTKDKQAVGASPGVALLHTAQELRGFNNPPKVVPKSDIDDLIKAGTHIELLRGVRAVGGKSAKDLANEFKTGDHFPGFGIFGAGTYADASRNTNILSKYGNQGGDMRLALPKSAKIVKLTDLQNAVPAPPSGVSINGPTSDTQENWWGIQATLAGYDAIHVNKPGQYGNNFHVILNRSILTVQKEDAKGATNR